MHPTLQVHATTIRHHVGITFSSNGTSSLGFSLGRTVDEVVAEFASVGVGIAVGKPLVAPSEAQLDAALRTVDGTFRAVPMQDF